MFRFFLNSDLLGTIHLAYGNHFQRGFPKDENAEWAVIRFKYLLHIYTFLFIE
jgi:hypothetical protein